ncbi:MAG: DUF1972 domain-containing protein [Cyclobacteriaceae bacterium]|nr:DUF1972 domain-containing protein [Cyclobacteriaceae bacterium]
MKIAILGTKGIPNNYGGYEQFAEYLSQRLVKRGHEVTVYNPSFHPFTDEEFKGVRIIRAYSPEKLIGGSANFIYDFLCLRDALKRDFDIIYEAGYHSVAPAYRLLGIRNRTKPIIITNMDGLEYNRSKWSSATQQLIRVLERIAVKDSPFMISDNLGIQEYYRTRFGRDSYFLPYGADPIDNFDESHLSKYGVIRHKYMILVARFEQENNIEMALDGFLAAECPSPFVVVGNHQTAYGNLLKRKYQDDRIRFVGGVYDKPVLDALRHYSAAYFHGHSVGGTNPSLLEAMACRTFIFAHDNPFNRHVLFDSAFYFNSASQVQDLLMRLDELREANAVKFANENDVRIRSTYNWDTIVSQHETLFEQLSANSFNPRQ